MKKLIMTLGLSLAVSSAVSAQPIDAACQVMPSLTADQLQAMGTAMATGAPASMKAQNTYITHSSNGLTLYSSTTQNLPSGQVSCVYGIPTNQDMLRIDVPTAAGKKKTRR